MGQLEANVKAPAAEPDKILAIVTNLSSSTVDAPRELRPELRNKLETAAQRHGGEVPLHGRLFRQWLHYAFPHECPLPISTGIPSEPPGATMSIGDNNRVEVAGQRTPSDTYWSDEEVLPLHEEWAPAKTSVAACLSVLRGVAFLAAAVAAIRAATSFMTSSTGLSNMLPSHSKEKHLHFA
jgi:hypothetical protein